MFEREWSDGPNLPRRLCDHVQLTMGGNLYVMGGLTSDRFGIEERVQTMYILDETHSATFRYQSGPSQPV
jgi:N-acetylneuraminic acid mutarotase